MRIFVRKYCYQAFFLCAIAFILAGCNGGELTQRQNFDRQIILKNIGENQILPVHQDFEDRCIDLESKINAFASGQDLASLETMREAWRSAALAWKYCEIFNLGTAKDSLFHNKIYKWPCNPVFIEDFISGTDSITPEYIDGKGSTAKGLAAIEYLLFDPAISDADLLATFTSGVNAGRRRAYLVSLGADVRDKSQRLNNEWKPSQGDMVGSFISNVDGGLNGSINELANQMVAVIEQVANNKIGKPIGKASFGIPQPEELEAFRSGRSIEHIRANLASLEAVYSGDFNGTNGPGYDDYLDALYVLHGESPLSEVISGQFLVTDSATVTVNPPMRDALYSQPDELEKLYNQSKRLLVLIKVDMASQLALTITFNDSDGD